MAFTETVERVKSGVLNINFLNTQNALVAKGTGFMCKGYLVTNNHVFQGPKNCRIWIRTLDTSESDLSEGVILEEETFKKALICGSAEANYDYAVLNIPQLQGLAIHNFTLASPEKLRIGDDIFFLGYPLEHFNLTCHKGIISSFFTRNNVRILQLDASVNASNSGGPLINPHTGEVIGMITRKATGLTRIIEELKKSIEVNIQAIQNARQGGGGILLMGIDPLKGIEISQVQALNLIREIERSANVGIGYAVSSEYLLAENIFN